MQSRWCSPIACASGRRGSVRLRLPRSVTGGFALVFAWALIIRLVLVLVILPGIPGVFRGFGSSVGMPFDGYREIALHLLDLLGSLLAYPLKLVAEEPFRHGADHEAEEADADDHDDHADAAPEVRLWVEVAVADRRHGRHRPPDAIPG